MTTKLIFWIGFPMINYKPYVQSYFAILLVKQYIRIKLNLAKTNQAVSAKITRSVSYKSKVWNLIFVQMSAQWGYNFLSSPVTIC